MRFPEWVDGGRKSKSAKASARLKFMLGQIAVSLTGKVGMRGLAEHVGLDQSLFYHYIRQGSFSSSSAEAIQKALGRKVIKAEHLIAPLEIELTT